MSPKSETFEANPVIPEKEVSQVEAPLDEFAPQYQSVEAMKKGAEDWARGFSTATLAAMESLRDLLDNPRAQRIARALGLCTVIAVAQGCSTMSTALEKSGVKVPNQGEVVGIVVTDVVKSGVGIVSKNSPATSVVFELLDVMRNHQNIADARAAMRDFEGALQRGGGSFECRTSEIRASFEMHLATPKEIAVIDANEMQEIEGREKQKKSQKTEEEILLADVSERVTRMIQNSPVVKGARQVVGAIESLNPIKQVGDFASRKIALSPEEAREYERLKDRIENGHYTDPQGKVWLISRTGDLEPRGKEDFDAIQGSLGEIVETQDFASFPRVDIFSISTIHFCIQKMFVT